MKISRLGPLKDIKIDLNKETIFLGKNNSGKTYVSYALYGILKHINELSFNFLDGQALTSLVTNRSVEIEITDIKRTFSDILKKEIDKNLSEVLSNTFRMPIENFLDSKIIFEKDELLNYLFNSTRNSLVSKRLVFEHNLYISLRIERKQSQIKLFVKEIRENALFDEDDNISLKNSKSTQNIRHLIEEEANQIIKRFFFEIPNLLYIPAERNGLNVFKNELMVERSKSYDISNNEYNKTAYPSPISDYLNYLNKVEFVKNSIINFKKVRDLDIYDDFAENILKGKYEFGNDGKELFYREFYSKSSSGLKFKSNKIPFHVSSSSTKTLYGLDYYFQSILSSNDILIIDEPEMNLDPETQIKMAELLAKLSNENVKVIVSTHSDYFVKSTTNILLKNEIVGEDTTLLRDKDVSLYIFSRDGVTGVKSLVKAKNISIFDDSNRQLENEYYDLLEQLDNMESGK